MTTRTAPPPVFAPARPAPAGTLAPPRPWPLREHPAFSHRPQEDWALVSCHFNPAGYARPVHNLGAFLDWCHAGQLPLWMGEIAYHDAPHQLPTTHPHVEQWRLCDQGIMFQKEAILQRMAMLLPSTITKVFLVDADVIYSDPDVFSRAALLMDDRGPRLVQPYHRATWLDQQSHPASSKYGTAWADSSLRPGSLDPAVYHPGFAVGLRREFFQTVGLRGCPITGTGDAALFQAAIAPHLPPPMPGRIHYSAPAETAWRDAVNAHVRGRIGYAEATAFHFYHGRRQARSYESRHKLLSFYNPDRHIMPDPATGLPIWTKAARPLQEAMKAYFQSRAEDT